MKRHTITLGASTTAGGQVISASSRASINSKTIALEGDAIFCPACKSKGKIVCIGPRIPETWNGTNVALENDLCACCCPNPPRLVPNQSLRYQVVDVSVANLAAPRMPAIAVASPNMNTKTKTKTKTMFDDRYVLIDGVTGHPLGEVEYAVKRESGTFEFGVTDTRGHTHLLAATLQSESIQIYL